MIRFPPRKILVAFDFTEPSLGAWRWAQGLARRYEAELEALYVEEPPPVAVWEMGYLLTPPETRVGLRRHMREALGKGARVRVEEGRAAGTILRVARAWRADLIVMGTHGREGLDRFWMGSVAEAVIRRSPVPVLAVRGAPKKVESILAPVNFTEYSRDGFAYAAAFAYSLKARLTALHAAEPQAPGNPEFWLRGLVGGLPEETRRRCRPEVLVLRGEPAEILAREAAKHAVVVLAAHKKSVLRDAVFGTTAEQVLRKAPAALLTVPARVGSFRYAQWTRGQETAPAA